MAHSLQDSLRKEACWTISNITAGNRSQIQAVLDANIIPPLLRILVSSDFKTRKEAAWAISNATSGGSDEQIKYGLASMFPLFVGFFHVLSVF